MRLICPNCGAQYEVPDDVIPAAGRDVQCSNCGHTWFETPGQSAAAEDVGFVPATLPDNATDAASRQPPETAPGNPSPTPPKDAPPVSQEPPAPETAPEPEASAPEAPEPEATAPETPAPTEHPAPPAALPDPGADAAIAALLRGQDPALPKIAPAERPAPQSQSQPQLQRRGLDPAVADILREEAAHEAGRRQASGGLESQPDLGIPDAPPIDPEEQRAQEARRRLALLKGENPNPQPATRRERLPDIEEINSTLRATSERGDADHIEAADAAPRQKRGFRLGFRLVALLAVLGFAAYALAPRISAAVPALEPTMTAYVAKVDEARLWLDAQMRSLLATISPQESSAPEITTDPAPAVDTAAPDTPEAPAATN